MISTNRKVVTFGEVMLRLTAPDFRRFSQTNEFIATYGGSEANVAVSLANFGIPTEFVTRLPTMQWRRHVSHRSVPTGWVRKESYSEGNAWDCIFLRVALRFAIPMWYTIVKGLLLPPCVPA